MKRRLTVNIESVPDGQVGPILASLGGVHCAADQPFAVYRPSPSSMPRSSTKSSTHRIVVGDAPTVQYYGDSFSNPSGAEGTAQYLVGIVENNKLRLIPTPIVHLVPRYKLIPATEPKRIESTTYVEARNQLGNAFGSKKSKSAIKALERGLINADALEQSVPEIQGSVNQSLAHISTPEEREAESKLDDPLPAHDLETTDVTKVYPLSGLLPTRSQTQLLTILSNTTDMSLLKSNLCVDVEALSADDARPLWIEREIMTLSAQLGRKVPRKVQLRLALCAWTLYLTRMSKCRDSHVKTPAFFAQVVQCPEILASDLISSFTEKIQISPIRVRKSITARTKTRLMCAILACYLHLHSFSVVDLLVAHDLGIEVKQVQTLLKSMGCVGTALSAAESAKLKSGGPSSSKGFYRFQLIAPLKFPSLTSRKKRKMN